MQTTVQVIFGGLIKIFDFISEFLNIVLLVIGCIVIFLLIKVKKFQKLPEKAVSKKELKEYMYRLRLINIFSICIIICTIIELIVEMLI
ncbi:hypothetical protein V7056_18085 [Bacillus sp. JJ664]